MEWLILGSFVAMLLVGVAMDLPLLLPLLGGYGLFFLYGLRRGHRPAALARMSLSGVRVVGNILFLFLLIGMITALWRACGTIPYLIYQAGGLISPSLFPLLAFGLCTLMSFLTGTSFGTAATMGGICMTMADTMGLPVMLSAGAILSGSFFGDRCSPMSTSALLVAALTETDLYRNLAGMMRTGAVPLAFASGIYLVLGLGQESGVMAAGLLEPFARGFVLHWTAVLPAAVIVVLSLFRCPVKWTMFWSILCSGALCVFLQGMPPAELVRTALLGYTPALEELKDVLSGGGLISMVTPLCIVSVSSTFSGLFEETGMLDGIKAGAAGISRRTTPFAGLFLVSVGTSLVSCNQTLAILLSHALCREEQTPEKLALGLEDTAVVLAPLVPWSIAGAVPLSTLHAPASALLGACYLYLIPLWNLVCSFRGRSQQEESHQGQGDGAEHGAQEVDLGGEAVVRAEADDENGDNGSQTPD